MAETKQAGHQWTLAQEHPREPRLGIFINYRRDDADDAAGWLKASLREDPVLQAHFDVFRDDDIGPLQKYEDVITERILASDVLLVVIGRQWLTIADKSGRPRLEQEDDLLRQEIEAALKSNVKVVPILLRGVSMPSRDDLPPSLAALAEWQAHRMESSEWRNHLAELVQRLDDLHAEKTAATTIDEETEEERARREREAAERARRARRQRRMARLRSFLTRPATIVIAAALVIALGAAIALWPMPEEGGWTNISDAISTNGADGVVSAAASVPNASIPYLAGGQAGGDAALWSSNDGRSWSPAAGDQLADATGAETAINVIVAPRKRNVIAIGQERSGVGQTDVAVWRSQDGRAEVWERVEDEDLGGSGRQVALAARRVHTPTDSFLLVGGYEGLQDDGQAALWRAPVTADSWDSISDDSFAEGDAASINRILCYPADEGCATIVALGWSSEAGNKDATVWTSTTGESGTWTRHPIRAPGNQRITDAVPFGDGLVAVGFSEPADGSGSDAAVWVSGDGANWTSAGNLERPGSQRVNVVVTPPTDSSLLIAAGSHQEEGAAHTDAAVWTSSDGQEWSVEGSSEAFVGAGNQAILSIVARREPVIAVGVNDDAPGVWCRGC
jgi:hypothetical protein